MARHAEAVARLAAVVGGRHVGAADVEVNDVTHDSREILPGSLFVALRGGAYDGHAFVDDAVSSGAAAVCVEHETGVDVPQILVDDTRSAAGPLAARVHGDPSLRLKVIGVTGTNGKTTVTHYIDSIASAAGLTTGLVGTIQTKIAGIARTSTLTTPEATDFQRLLGEMVDGGVDLAAVEVSSHALELGRVNATRFEVAAFTNLSQDHLDFHGDMEAYRAAKATLFSDYDVATAVFNVDDPVGRSLAASHRGPVVTVGSAADVELEEVLPLGGGQTRCRIRTPWGTETANIPVVGDFNLSNLAIAITCAIAAGVSFEDAVASLPNVSGVPGRYEVVSGPDPITVIVDYAHTPEAVARSIDVARASSSGRIIALLGAGGDRDRQKRPAMGEALGAADLAIVTSDNPRSESPESIVESVASGLVGDHLVEVDRRTAIELAIDAAVDGDTVLILGRGHEPYQQVGDQKIPFDDREVAVESLHRRRSAETGPISGSMTT